MNQTAGQVTPLVQAHRWKKWLPIERDQTLAHVVPPSERISRLLGPFFFFYNSKQRQQ